MAVSMERVPNFHELSPAAAMDHLSDLTDYCEINGIYLSPLGNDPGRVGIEEYRRDKAEHKLFDVEKVQAAYAAIDKSIKPAQRIFKSSAAIAEFLDLPNGTVIAAMILHGYRANFQKKGQRPAVNCEFKVEFITNKA